MRNHSYSHSLLAFSILTSGLMVSKVADAAPMKVKDWTLSDSGTTCIASTERSISGKKFRLELSLDKSGVYPVETWIREIPETGKFAGFRFITEVKPIKKFPFVLMQDGSGNKLFWQVPTDTEALISYIKRQTRLLTYGIPTSTAGANSSASTAVDFSLSGSSAILSALETKCIRGSSLLKTEFEKNFTPALVAQLDPSKINAESAAKLRNLYLKSLADSQQKSALENELTSLNNRYAKQIQELGKLNGTLDELTQKELINLQNQKLALEEEIKSLDQQLIRQKLEIDQKESEVVAANAVYNQAWKVIEPFEPEHQRLSKDLDSSQNNLESRRSELAQINSEIQAKGQDIANYENHVNSLRSELSQKESELRYARIDIDNTESIYRRFDMHFEQQDRITSHPVFRYCRRSHHDECRRIMNEIGYQVDQEVSNVNLRLSDNYSTARNRSIELSDIVSGLDSQIRNYLNYEIPNLRNEISNLQSQRPAIERSISIYQTEVNNKQNALQTYDRSVGYGSKKAELERTASIVVHLQDELTGLETVRQNIQQRLNNSNYELTATNKGIEDVLLKIRQTQDKSSELSKVLEPYFAEKEKLEVSISDLTNQIEGQKQEFSQIVSSN